MKRPKHRVFDYPPRFYDPSKDEQERRKRRLGFSQMRSYNKKKKSPVIWLLFILVIVFVIIKLTMRG